MSSTYIGESGPFRKTNRAAFVNFLRAKYEMFTGARQVSSYPYYLTLDPSDVCQLQCPTCPTGMENAARRDKTSIPLVYRSNRRLLDDSLFEALITEMGEYLFLIVFYDWGEPLLNKRLPDYIARANALDIETEINTNLSLKLTDAFIEHLLTSGLNYVEVSIDGFTQATYETHRRGGKIDLVKKNLERLVEVRQRLKLTTSITYNFIVFSFNEHEIKDARRYAKELGIHFNTREAITDNPEWLPSYRRNESPLLSDEEYESLHTEPGQPKPHYLRWSPLAQSKTPKTPSACGWHYGYSVVTAGGPVQPCCSVAHESDDFGTVKPGDTRFADVWNNDRYQSARAAFDDAPDEQGTQIGSVCTDCHFPKLMQHMYSLHDMKVFAQYERVFGKSDPVLYAAFRLLAWERYGRIVHGLYRRGIFSPLVQSMVLNGDERRADSFVNFFEEHLLHESLAIELTQSIAHSAET